MKTMAIRTTRRAKRTRRSLRRKNRRIQNRIATVDQTVNQTVDQTAIPIPVERRKAVRRPRVPMKAMRTRMGIVTKLIRTKQITGVMKQINQVVLRNRNQSPARVKSKETKSPRGRARKMILILRILMILQIPTTLPRLGQMTLVQVDPVPKGLLQMDQTRMTLTILTPKSLVQKRLVQEHRNLDHNSLAQKNRMMPLMIHHRYRSRHHPRVDQSMKRRPQSEGPANQVPSARAK
mmetsp:Transcript_31911/g.77336  ORF Transcript_31911/g.77336 Transcript_31911/m.77336 type:complete len:235 (-) Transcript_31911:4118-4822(-)